MDTIQATESLEFYNAVEEFEGDCSTLGTQPGNSQGIRFSCGARAVGDDSPTLLERAENICHDFIDDDVRKQVNISDDQKKRVQHCIQVLWKP